MGFGRGFSAPPSTSGASSTTTKVSRTISTYDRESAYSFKAADIINGAFHRIIPPQTKIVDSLTISDVDKFAASCGISVGETISIKMLLQNEGGQYTISPSFPRGVSLFGDSLPSIQDTSSVLDLTFFYVENAFLAINVNNQEIRK